jgi:hypothetical protein
MAAKKTAGSARNTKAGTANRQRRGAKGPPPKSESAPGPKGASRPKGVAARQVSVTNADLEGPDRWTTLIKVSAESGVALEDIEALEDVTELRSVVRDKIEEAVGARTIGAWSLSTEPLRGERRELPVPGVDRIEPTEKWRQRELERAALGALRLAYSLGRDPLGRQAPLHIELQFALKFTELIETFNKQWAEAAGRAAIPMVFHELSRLYEWVASHWKRRRPRASTVNSVSPTTTQNRVLAKAAEKIRTILDAHGRYLSYAGPIQNLVPLIVLGGPEIRAHGGPRDAASFALTQLTGLKERAIQNTLNEISPLEVARYQHASHDGFADQQLPRYLQELLFGERSIPHKFEELGSPPGGSKVRPSGDESG